jgi:hypothetical protein
MSNSPQHQDERDLWNEFGVGASHRTPRDAGIALGIPRKRVDYLCHKWSRQRRYDYGVCVDLGWKVKP